MGWAIRAAVVALALGGLATEHAVAQNLPVVKGKKVVATVDGEPITLDEFNQEVAEAKQEGSEMDRPAQLALLDRLIRMVLIAQEARRMELDKQPQVQKMIDVNARISLRNELVAHTIKSITADPKKVEETYQAAVRQWKVSAAFFDKEEHARSMEAEIIGGKSFGEVAARYAADGRSTRLEDGVLIRSERTDPAVARALAAMSVGSTSPVVLAKAGFVILQLEGVDHPDDPAARARAEQVVLTTMRREAVAALDQTLKKKYVKINREVLDAIDYEADSPGIEAFLKDRRVLAEIKGEAPVAVADLTEELRFQFFHGATPAAERKRMNAKKEQALDGLVHRKVFRKEALRLGLDKAAAYRASLRAYERSVLLNLVIRKVIAPGIKLGDGELRAYYEEHRQKYTTPEMMRIRGLAFSDRKAAASALESLRKGADFQWVADRAEGQVDRNTEGHLSFDGKPIMTAALPDDVEKAVAGARPGDIRLYASPQKHHYVLVVQDVVAAQPRPFDEVRREIAEKVLAVKIQKAVEDYADKLRSLSSVQVHLKAS